MVKGLERFREHFKGHEASYALIGGVACDIHFGEAVDARHIRKQRADVFRLTQLLPGEGSLALADSMRADLGEFLGQALGDPDFDYAALRLPITLDDATAILGRYYRLNSSD